MEAKSASSSDQGAPREVIDLTDSAGEVPALAREPATKRLRLSGGGGKTVHESDSSTAASFGARNGTKPIEYLSLPGGVLDDTILKSFDAIAQQLNCVGCDGRGLAEGVQRTIDIRRPPDGKGPAVINLFAQWEMGVPGKYNRVKPAPPDSASAREHAFKECLDKIAALEGDERPSTIAFPHEIGCGLAGGSWRNYEAMIKAFAAKCPDMHISICRWTGGGGAGAGGKARAGVGLGDKSRDVCFHCKQPGHWAARCPKKK